MLRRLKETTVASFKKVKEAVVEKAHGIGTPIAGYSEEGPFHCDDCIFIVKRSEDGRGLCKETHMKADPKVKKNKKGLAIVKLQTGCCEYVDPGGK